MPEFTVTLPMPPSVNALYIGTGKNKRRNPNYAAWADEAGWRMNEERAAGRFVPIGRDGWYWTDIRLPLNHIGDSDNRLKALHDLLHTMGATPDDKWLLGGTYMRCPAVASGTCVVHARAVPEGPVEVTEQAAFLAQRLAPEVGDKWRSIGAIARDMIQGEIG